MWHDSMVLAGPLAVIASERWWGWLADAILAVHVAFVLFIVLGLPLIWLGAVCRWRIARHRLFRFLHLGAMGFVLFETLLGMVCPLTEWEAALRERAGQPTYGDDSFMQYWLQNLLYWDWSHTTFVVLYIGVFAAIVITYIVVPPDRKVPRDRVGAHQHTS